DGNAWTELVAPASGGAAQHDAIRPDDNLAPLGASAGVLVASGRTTTIDRGWADDGPWFAEQNPATPGGPTQNGPPVVPAASPSYGRRRLIALATVLTALGLVIVLLVTIVGGGGSSDVQNVGGGPEGALAARARLDAKDAPSGWSISRTAPSHALETAPREC